MPEELATMETPPSGAEDKSTAESQQGSEPQAPTASEGTGDHAAGAEPPDPPAPPTAEEENEPEEPAGESNKRWYVVKVQSGREESIKEAIERRVKIEGLEDYFGQIIIPVEKVTEMRNGKRVVRERKLYPGYLMVEVEYNDRILYLFRETSGVGDFVGGSVNRAPPPMSDREIERMLHGQIKGAETKAEEGKVVYTKPRFGPGDRVKVTDGTFAGMEGDVKELHEAKGSVSVE